jgi:hypothetical protein
MRPHTDGASNLSHGCGLEATSFGMWVLQVVGVDPVGSILAQPESLNGAITSYVFFPLWFTFF